jgi:hypothetical protein
MLFGSLMPLLTAQETCRVYTDPLEIHNEDMSLTSFTIDINVENVVDLFGFGVRLNFEPYTTMFVVSSVVEGDFLLGGSEPTDFVYTIDSFAGTVEIGNSRRIPDPGVSGSGTLASVTLKVEEMHVTDDPSPIFLDRVELYDTTPALIPCDLAGSNYFGPPRPDLDKHIDVSGFHGAPFAFAGMNVTIRSRVINHATVPMMIRINYNLERKDGLVEELFPGQFYRSVLPTPPDPIYLYVDGYIPHPADTWTKVGSSPWLDAAGDGNYVTCAGPDGAWTIFYTFEDMTSMPPGEWRILRTELEAYTDGTYNEGIDYDAVRFDTGGTWVGSLYSSGAPAWVGVRWVPPGYGMPTTMSEVNDFFFGISFYDPDGLADGTDMVDAARIKVVFASTTLPRVPPEPPVQIVPPGAHWVDEAIWMTFEENMGNYKGTATMQYSFNGYTWYDYPDVAKFNVKVWKPWPGN